MAGRGERLKPDFPGIPKPYVGVAGKPALIWSLMGFDLTLFDEVIFITNKETVDYRNPLDVIFSSIRVDTPMSMVVLDEVPNGQAHTLRLGLLESEVRDSFMVFNCDTYMLGVDKSWMSKLKECKGAMGVFPSNNPGLSYARIDDQGVVIETAEKRVISKWASTGLYWFHDTDSFLRLDLPTDCEAYIAPLYNQMIEKGQKIVGIPCKSFFPLGNKEEIETFERHIFAP
jgi:NDP-sugar pyrophosphorylase family protein